MSDVAVETEAGMGPGPLLQHRAPDEPRSRFHPDEGRHLRVVVPVEPGSAFADDGALADARLPDSELIVGIVAGDTAALAELYDRHGQAVFAVLTRIVGDRGAAEDLLQDVFLRAWQQAHTFDPARGTVRGWLHCMAHTQALNELRRRRRRPRVYDRTPSDDADSPDAYDACIDPAPDPAACACCADRDAAVTRALGLLPSEQRDVLLLYAAGYSQAEIAAQLGEPLGTVKSRMRRSLGRLREVLPAEGIDAGWPGD